MLSTVFVITVSLYATAAALYLAFLVRGHEGHHRAATALLTGAFLAHVAFFGVQCTSATPPDFSSIYQSMSVASLVMVLAFLGATRKYRTSVLGAFITPVTLLFFLGAALGGGAGEVPHEVKRTLLPVHIAVNVLGVAAFAVAFGASVAYLIEERLLRQKKVLGLFRRLPPLDVLDTLGFRFLLVGFPLLTVGLVTGAFWIVRGAGGGTTMSPAQALGIVTWVVFAGVLLLRTMAGWRGRKAALGTLVGFACASGVFAAYIWNAMGSHT